jgi:hypothetical protein
MVNAIQLCQKVKQSDTKNVLLNVKIYLINA